MTTHDLYFIPNGREAYHFNSSTAQIVNITGLSENGVTVLTTKLYNQSGELFIDVNQQVRIISVDWVVRGDLSTIRRDIAAKFNPNLGQGVLVYENDLAKYKINAVVSLKPEHEKLIYNQVKMAFNLSFICPKPDWLSYLSTTIKMEAFIGGLTLPLTLPFTLAELGDGAEVDYTGDNPASVQIDLRGDAVNPVIENTTTGLSLETKNLSLAVGEKLLINTNPDSPSVQIDDGAGNLTDAWNKLEEGSKFWLLEYGTNQIDFSADSGSPECYLTWNEHYSGV